MLVGCPECTVRRGSHVSLPRLPNRACSITPLTHNHPSLPPSLPVALFHSSIDSFLSVQKKHYTVRALANQCSMCSLSEWFLNIVHKLNQTSLGTLSGTFIVSLSEAKTCRLITSHKTGTPDFYKERQSGGLKKHRDQSDVWNTWTLSQESSQNAFSSWSHAGWLTLFTPLCQYWHHYLPNLSVGGLNIHSRFCPRGGSYRQAKTSVGRRYFYFVRQCSLAENAEQMATVVVDIKMFTTGNKHGLL